MNRRKKNSEKKIPQPSKRTELKTQIPEKFKDLKDVLNVHIKMVYYTLGKTDPE